MRPNWASCKSGKQPELFLFLLCFAFVFLTNLWDTETLCKAWETVKHCCSCIEKYVYDAVSNRQPVEMMKRRDGSMFLLFSECKLILLGCMPHCSLWRVYLPGLAQLHAEFAFYFDSFLTKLTDQSVFFFSQMKVYNHARTWVKIRWLWNRYLCVCVCVCVCVLLCVLLFCCCCFFGE